jgi:hypothetical protein
VVNHSNYDEDSVDEDDSDDEEEEAPVKKKTKITKPTADKPKRSTPRGVGTRRAIAVFNHLTSSEKTACQVYFVFDDVVFMYLMMLFVCHDSHLGGR